MKKSEVIEDAPKTIYKHCLFRNGKKAVFAREAGDNEALLLLTDGLIQRKLYPNWWNGEYENPLVEVWESDSPDTTKEEKDSKREAEMQEKLSRMPEPISVK